MIEPFHEVGQSAWRCGQDHVEVRLVGKGTSVEPIDTSEGRCSGIERAWLQQYHSAEVVDASVGDCGRGDALVTQRLNLALTIVTADCVPVLLAGSGTIAAVHAGWRGLAHSILSRTLERMQPSENDVTAWIGPAIGQCCYEVGDDVAKSVCAASSEQVGKLGPRGKKHLDLVKAARYQLEKEGVSSIHALELCTRCHPDRLWSYRREGPRAGRNVAMIWRRSSG